ncbi:MAG: TMEM175 family protein [Steroidobacteraceae bacterium]
MGKNRLEAFSDGVLAIIITIMVLELKVPHADGFDALRPLAPVFMSYVLSFVYLGIYWNNHHDMLHICTRVTGSILWANLHLLFWLSLFPFVTAWMGENHFAALPSALYGVVLFAAAMVYWILQQTIIAAQGSRSPLKAAIGRDWKGKVSPVIYAVGIVSTFRWPWVGQLLYVLVALMWLVPDRRIEGRKHLEVRHRVRRSSPTACCISTAVRISKA